MKRGHIPIRTCVGCRRRRPKSELVRFAVAGIDAGGRPAQGRGVYLCPEAACVEKALARADIKKKLGSSTYAGILRRLETVTTGENCLDGSSPGSVICDNCHGGGAFG